MVYMIGTLKNNSDLVGIVILDTETNEVTNLVLPIVYNIMNSNVQIENLRLKDNKLVGYGGSLDRYTSFDIKTKSV